MGWEGDVNSVLVSCERRGTSCEKNSCPRYRRQIKNVGKEYSLPLVNKENACKADFTSELQMDPSLRRSSGQRLSSGSFSTFVPLDITILTTPITRFTSQSPQSPSHHHLNPISLHITFLITSPKRSSVKFSKTYFLAALPIRDRSPGDAASFFIASLSACDVS